MDLYTGLATDGTLTDEHRSELRTKRGFTDETIAKCGFISGGPVLMERIATMSKKVSLEALVRAGLWTAATSPPGPAATWSQGVIIPYWQGDKCTYLRRHKHAAKGVPLQPYLPARMAPENGRVVLCESEFKAAAAMQLGFTAVGVAGIATFTKRRWPDLLKVLKAADEVVVCFDSEDKSTPGTGNYKPDPSRRHDTEWYSFLLAKLCVKAKLQARVATLPAAWRVDGKVDIDMALAQGRTAEDFERVFAEALPPKLYLDGLCADAQKICLSRWASVSEKTRLRVDGNRYFWESTKEDGTEYVAQVSNFRLELLATFDDTTSGCHRMVVFVDELGRRSRPAMLSPEELGGVGGFQVWCLSKGNYIWSGSIKALQAVAALLFRTSGDRLIHRPDHVGLIEDGLAARLWLFGNCGLTLAGETVLPDEEGIVYLEGGEGYRARSFAGNDDKKIQDRRPSIWRGPTKWDLPTLAKAMCESFGTMAPAVGLGWVVASLLSSELFPIWHSFPFLFLFGKRRGGKSTLARWLCAVAGVETEGESLSNSTVVAVGRHMSYYSSLPVWLDEYRNDQSIKTKWSFLRNLYNRQGGAKGVKADFGVTTVCVRGCLMLSGEDSPADSALYSRCVICPIEESHRATRDHNPFATLQAQTHEFSNVIPGLVQAQAKRLGEVKARVREAYEDYQDQGLDARTAVNWGLVSGCYLELVDYAPESFGAYCVEHAIQAHRACDEESAATQFVTDLGVMARSGRLNGPEHDNADLRVHGDLLYVRVPDAYSKWCEDLRKRGQEPWKISTIDHALKDSPGYLGVQSQRVPTRASSSRCFVWDLTVAGPEVRALAGVGD